MNLSRSTCSINLSLSTCLYEPVSINLSLSICLYQLVCMNLSRSTCSINLSLSTCLYEPVSINLSLSICLYQLAVSTCLYQLVSINLSLYRVSGSLGRRRRRGFFAWQARHWVTLRSLWSFWMPLTPRLLCMGGAALAALGDSL